MHKKSLQDFKTDFAPLGSLIFFQATNPIPGVVSCVSATLIMFIYYTHKKRQMCLIHKIEKTNILKEQLSFFQKYHKPKTSVELKNVSLLIFVSSIITSHCFLSSLCSYNVHTYPSLLIISFLLPVHIICLNISITSNCFLSTCSYNTSVHNYHHIHTDSHVSTAIFDPFPFSSLHKPCLSCVSSTAQHISNQSLYSRTHLGNLNSTETQESKPGNLRSLKKPRCPNLVISILYRDLRDQTWKSPLSKEM